LLRCSIACKDRFANFLHVKDVRACHLEPSNLFQAITHVYNRGAARLSIIREERNYRYLLRLMKDVATECNLTIIASCLLPNHYHWLVRQDGATPVGMLPKRVFGSYSQAFNKAYKGSGTLFEGAFRGTLVDTESYPQTFREAQSFPEGIGLNPPLDQRAGHPRRRR
jgi:REP element-mobilizing transposase RayT